MAEFVVQHPRTRMFIAEKERPKNIRFGAGFGQDYRWVRTVGEASKFNCFTRAEEPPIFLRLNDYEIRPVLSCGLAGDPVTRDEAMATGTFHTPKPASVDRSGEAGETGTGSTVGESAVPAEERADAHPSTPES